MKLVPELIQFLLERFTFIGLQELYTFSIKTIFMLLGMRIDPELRLREKLNTQTNEAKITEGEILLVERLNNKDYEIFTYFRARYKRIEPRLYPYLDFDRLFKMINSLPYTSFD